MTFAYPKRGKVLPFPHRSLQQNLKNCLSRSIFSRWIESRSDLNVNWNWMVTLSTPTTFFSPTVTIRSSGTYTSPHENLIFAQACFMVPLKRVPFWSGKKGLRHHTHDDIICEHDHFFVQLPCDSLSLAKRNLNGNGPLYTKICLGCSGGIVTITWIW